MELAASSNLANLGEAYTWPSCVFGRRGPGNQRLYQTYAGVALNLDISAMRRPMGLCRQEPPGRVGHCAGQRSTVSGEYPPEMCAALAGIIAAHVRGA